MRLAGLIFLSTTQGGVECEPLPSITNRE